jgi:hypothetical protein
LVKLTERINAILSLVERFKVVELSHVVRLYYKDKYGNINAQKRLTAMCRDGLLKRKRSNVNLRYYYYLGKEPAQVQHKLMLTELYVNMCCKHGISNVTCTPEYTIEGVRPDAYIEVIDRNRKYLFFVEVQIAHTPVDLAKYEMLYRKKPFGDAFPTILVLGKTARHEYLNVVCVNDMGI